MWYNSFHIFMELSVFCAWENQILFYNTAEKFNKYYYANNSHGKFYFFRE